jgi:hypothetical protein
MDTSSPYRVYHDPTLPPFLNTSGYTKVSCTLGAGRNAVIIAVGQSNLTNVVVGTPYTVASSNNQHFNLYDQNCYQSKDTLLGVAFPFGAAGNVMARVADNLISNNEKDRIIVVPMAEGSSVAMWNDAPYLKNRVSAVAHMLAAAGLSATHVVWGQGEHDCVLGAIPCQQRDMGQWHNVCGHSERASRSRR